jgi:hypothetical protein
MNAYEALVNHQVVLDAFGQWPSFHDGEVHRVVLDRTRRTPGGSYYPSLELYVRGWILTSEITEAGYYKQEHDSVVHFLFEEVSELELDGLNHQNVLSALDFEVSTDNKSGAQLIAVELSHCYGLSGAFKALRASVVSVVPYAREAA